MGLFERLFPRTAGVVNLALTDLPVLSPWATTQLTKVVIGELAGIQPGVITRAHLMRIPAVVRGRGLICGTLARHPLTLWQYGATPTQVETAAWMTSTTTGQGPALRLLWTLDDLIFSGLSLWAAQRDTDGNLTDAVRVPPNEWSVDPNTHEVLINGKPISDPSEVILFEGPQEGLCVIAEESAVGSRDLSNAWRQRVSAPVPLVAIRQTDPNAQLTPKEVDEMLGNVEKAHEERYNKLAERVEKGEVFERAGVKVWKCLNCGHLHVGPTAPAVCPVCNHPQSYFEEQCINY